MRRSHGSWLAPGALLVCPALSPLTILPTRPMVRCMVGDSAPLSYGASGNVGLIQCCACGLSARYEKFCRVLCRDPVVRLSTHPTELLRARYSAGVDSVTDFIIATIHHTNDEYLHDKDEWRVRILDFANAAKFAGLEIQAKNRVADDIELVTWHARMHVLSDMVRKKLIETKEFIEGSVWIEDDGVWFYQKGMQASAVAAPDSSHLGIHIRDPDSKPKSIRFTRFVEVGRVCLINYGPENGKLCTIIDIVDGNKCLVEGPAELTGVARQMIPFKRLALTDFKVAIPKNARQKTVKNAWKQAKILEKWENTAWAKKLVAKKKRANLTDFERFQLMIARKQRSALVNEKLKAIQDGSLVPAPRVFKTKKVDASAAAEPAPDAAKAEEPANASDY